MIIGHLPQLERLLLQLRLVEHGRQLRRQYLNLILRAIFLLRLGLEVFRDERLIPLRGGLVVDLLLHLWRTATHRTLDLYLLNKLYKILHIRVLEHLLRQYGHENVITNHHQKGCLQKVQEAIL